MSLKERKKKHSRKRSLVILLVLAVCACLAGGTYTFSRLLDGRQLNGLRPPQSAKPAVEKAKIYSGWREAQKPEELRLTAWDGTPLVGWYIKAARPSGRLVVLIHGYKNDASLMAGYAKYYHEDGFDVFLADNRGHGVSGGEYIGMGWLDRLDYLGWLDLLVQKTGPDSEIVLHGLSMGGAAVMGLSSEVLPPQVKAIIEDSGYSSVYDEFLYQIKDRYGYGPLAYPLLAVADLESRLLAGYGFSEADFVNAVSTAPLPILFIHGSADTFVPPCMALKLYEAASGEKELWILPGVDHGMAFDADPDEYFARIKSFYDKYLQRR